MPSIKIGMSMGSVIFRRLPGVPPVNPTLNALTLSAATVAEDVASGVTVGNLIGRTSGSTLALADDAGGRFALSGATLVTGLTGFDFETATSHQITVRETLAGATNTPRDTTLTINVTDVVEQVGDEIHVFLVAGQSNASGRAPDDGGTVYPDGVMEWRESDWQPIGSRLYHGTDEEPLLAYRPDAAANFGFARTFADAYLAANPGVTLYLAGAGDGGTGFGTGDWNKGNGSYSRAVSRINAALAAAPAGAVFKGILWHQGENDAQTEGARAAYNGALTQMIADMRGDITGGANAPFVVGGHFLGGQFYHPDIQRVVQSIPNQVLYTGYADISSPVEAVGVPNDGAHFGATSARNLGPQYAKALVQAQENDTLGGGGTVTFGTPQAHALASTTNVQTVSAVNLGSPAADRMIVVACFTRGTSAGTPYVDQLSVGGVDLARMDTPGNSTTTCNLTLLSGIVPDGATGDVTLRINSSVGTTLCGMVVLPVYGARPHLANHLGSAILGGGASFGSTASLNVEAQAGDVVIAASGAILSSSFTASWNLDQNLHTAFGNNGRATLGYGVVGTSGTQTATITYSQSINHPGLQVMVLRAAGAPSNSTADYFASFDNLEA